MPNQSQSPPVSINIYFNSSSSYLPNTTLSTNANANNSWKSVVYAIESMHNRSEPPRLSTAANANIYYCSRKPAANAHRNPDSYAWHYSNTNTNTNTNSNNKMPSRGKDNPRIILL